MDVPAEIISPEILGVFRAVADDLLNRIQPEFARFEELAAQGGGVDVPTHRPHGIDERQLCQLGPRGAEIKDFVTHFLYEETNRTPIVIPVVNVVGGSRPEGQNDRSSTTRSDGEPVPVEKSPEEVAAEQQKRFQEMRARLLGTDQQD